MIGCEQSFGPKGEDRQYRSAVIGYQPSKTLVVIEYLTISAQCMRMKHAVISIALAALVMAPGIAMAETCYADYKAKQDNPLRLHYGIVQLIGPCKKGAAKSELSARLEQNGWKLLNVLSVFGPEGLQQRKANAGSYYLRF